MKQTLYTFGCSHVRGDGLPDTPEANDYKNKPGWEDNGSKYVWGNLVSQHLDYNIVNRGTRGGSMLSILWELYKVRDNITKDDLVLIMPTYKSRWGKLIAREKTLLGSSKPKNFIGKIKKMVPLLPNFWDGMYIDENEAYYKYLWNEESSRFNMFMVVNAINNILNEIGCRYHYLMLRKDIVDVFNEFNLNERVLPVIKFTSVHNNYPLTECKHMGVEGQIVYSNKVIQAL